jgi:hypothetical protein
MSWRGWTMVLTVGIGLMVVPLVLAWPHFQPPPPNGGDQPQPPFNFFQPPPGGGPFPIGPGGPMGQERKLLKQFDADGNGILNKTEREEARAFLKKDSQRGPRGFGPPPGFGPPGGFGHGEPGKPGPRVSPAEAQSYPDQELYAPYILRTLFLEFENSDWEAELEDFHNSDVEVPCTLSVDGKRYPNVGVHFRGMSSYMGVQAGSKRSLNLSLDCVDPEQRLHGYKTLNLLNAHEDATFMSTVLYSHLARQHIAAPKANFVKVVINGESWGIYANVQQFDKLFVAENYKSAKGARWKVRGSPGGRGGLEYLGDNLNDYKRIYEIKTADKAEDWKALIKLCQTLNQTPPDQLEAALKPMLDLDELLWFLALDIGLINCDGYWIRASDFSIHRDDKGKFHIIPHDMNEAFRPGMGPGFGGPGGGMIFRFPPPGELLPGFLQDMLQLNDAQKKQLGELQKEADQRLDQVLTADQRAELKKLKGGGPVPFGPPGAGGPPPGAPGLPPGGQPMGPGGGPRGGGVEIDPLHGLNDLQKPLRSKILAVPALKARYLANLRTLAEESLDWKRLGPVVQQYRELIAKEVEADTRKLTSFDAFQRATAETPAAGPMPQGRGPGMGMNLKSFAGQRRQYLLNHPEIKQSAKGDAQ